MTTAGAIDALDRMLVEQIVSNESPSVAVAYLLAILLGFVSAHRFYLRRPGTAILQILSYFVVVGFLWWLIDLFLIQGMVEAARAGIRSRETARVLAAKPLTSSSPPAPAPIVTAQLIRDLLQELSAG